MNDTSRVSISLWGKDVELDVVFDCYEDEEILAAQSKSINGLLTSWDSVEGAAKEIAAFIRKNYGVDVSDVYDYIEPRKLFVKRVYNRVVALMCTSTLDPEHGFAIVFENEKLRAIGAQDIVL